MVGRGGVRLSEKWAQGMRTLHGLHTHGFPNLFIISNGQSAFTTNFPHSMDHQAKHISYIIDECAKRKIASVEATLAAEDAWVDEIISVSRYNEDFLSSCTPGYYNNEGQPNPKSMQNGAYGKGPNPYFAKMAAWREANDLAGLALSYAN